MSSARATDALRSMRFLLDLTCNESSKLYGEKMVRVAEIMPIGPEMQR